MDKESRFVIGFNIETGSTVIENPRWMSETRARRLFRPVARVINFLKYEPLRDGMWPIGDPNAHGGSMGVSSTPESKGMIGVLARIELNEKDGKDLNDGLPENALYPKN